jgi:hypothetical protein
MLALGMPIKLDAQASPLGALLVAAGVCLALWLIVLAMNRRDIGRRR